MNIIDEWLTRYDASTLHDIPDTAEWMAESERLHMWAYPEPDYSSFSDGSMMTLAAWFIETSISRFERTIGDSIFMGSDEYHYFDADEDTFPPADISGYTDRYPSHWND